MRIRQTVAALVVGALLSAGAAYATSISRFPAPMDPSQQLSNFNTLVDSINRLITNYVYFVGTGSELGEMQFTNSGTWAVNSNVATGLTSLGPQGSHTTVQEWLTVVNPNGFVRYIPTF